MLISRLRRTDDGEKPNRPGMPRRTGDRLLEAATLEPWVCRSSHISWIQITPRPQDIDSLRLVEHLKRPMLLLTPPSVRWRALQKQVEIGLQQRDMPAQTETAIFRS